MEQMMSLKDIAALLNCKAYRVEYLLAHGLVPEPKLRIRVAAYSGPKDLARFAEPTSARRVGRAQKPRRSLRQ